VRTSSVNSRRASDEQLTWHDRAWISFRPDAGIVLTR
jgi:putrescine transport system ATP-binding protein